MYKLNFHFLQKYWFLFVNGAANTLILSFFTVFFGTLIGVLIALLRLSGNRLLRYPAQAYIEVIRGTPMLVQICFIFYALPQMGIRIPEVPLFGGDFPRYVSGVIALSLNSGAYVAEIIRAGIQAVDKGQVEAARSLGMTQMQAMGKIILPQAFKNILPALGNEFVTIIKESSIVSVIGVGELMFRTATVYGNSFRYFESLIICAIIYFIMTFTTSRLLGIMERRMHAGD
ncbi:amino acid ABC transporter, permease protein, His/Glu/Gln/Arg/opine family [Treponema primitia ZAS-2]|uniref:Putative glutamine transport system permease protein GlnP n=1 Tax=Treponema primitia (strain ATCC BAA-887 / DSM 12427 / ZAS-2) TaxID=545694 RepID=F5YJG3_TREPZ|nr:amino acid ABC transporter permease [Treponema primitia]AEF85998.1 amino acid ABC transporter, permease protein, His/Glu/Gln/Arg/opine family [Treponema primitia ZAS-2]